MQNYADVLEGYLIPAEEGFGDVLKKAAGAVAKGFRAALAFIRKILGAIAQKIRSIFSKKKKDNGSSEDAKSRLEKENEEMRKKIAYLEKIVNDKDEEIKNKETLTRNQADAIKSRDDQIAAAKSEKEYSEDVSRNTFNKLLDTQKSLKKESGKHERATKMIAELKKQITANEEKMKTMEKNASNKAFFARFEQIFYQFTTLVSGQINKGYSELPKIIERARAAGNRKVSNEGEKIWKDIDEEIYDKIPTMKSGSWSNLYKNLKYNFVPEIEKTPEEFLEFNSRLGNACELVVTQGNKCIEYLENVAKQLENEENDRIGAIVRQLSQEEGFIDMLKSSVSIMNKILNCYSANDINLSHNIYDTL